MYPGMYLQHVFNGSQDIEVPSNIDIIGLCFRFARVEDGLRGMGVYVGEGVWRKKKKRK